MKMPHFRYGISLLGLTDMGAVQSRTSIGIGSVLVREGSKFDGHGTVCRSLGNRIAQINMESQARVLSESWDDHGESKRHDPNEKNNE
jgi:hypothetical protein